MRRPGPTIALMIGIPLARDHDHLDRQDINDDRAEDTITEIYKGLRAHRPEAADCAMAIAKCLERMVHAASRSDDRALQKHYELCCSVIDGQDKG